MKKLIAIFSCLLCACVCCFVACEDTTEQQETYRVRLNNETIRIYPYEEAELFATVYDEWEQTVEGAAVVWTVADESVATFDDGVVTGRSVGETSITAKYENFEAQCKIVVRETEYVPSVQTDKNELALLAGGDEIELNAWVFYNDERYTQDASFVYQVADETVAAVDGEGPSVVARGLKKGETTITVTASWRGAESATLTKTVAVTVTDLMTVTFTDLSQKTVYTSDVEGHDTTAQLVPLVKKNEVAVIDPVLTYTVTDEYGQPSDLVTVDGDGTVYANEEGRTGTAYVRYTFEEIYSSRVCVRVEYPVIDKTDLSLYLEMDENKAVSLSPLKKLLETEDLVGVDGYACENGSIADASAGEQIWNVIHAEHYATAVSVTVCTKIIRTADDLDKMLSVYATKTKVGSLNYNSTTNDVYSYDGYFILGDNIDYSQGGVRGVYNSGVLAQSFANSGSQETVALMGFNGIFDGCGYTIKNISFDCEESASFITGGGLFGAIGKNGVVKNFALVNAELEKNGGNAPLATVISGTVDNVYIDLQKVDGDGNSRAAGVACATFGATLSNIYIQKANAATGSRLRSGYVSIYDAARSGQSTTAKNIYIYNDSNIQPWIAQNENGTTNPYGAKGTGVFKNVTVYSSIDMTQNGYDEFAANLTCKTLNEFKLSDIAFDDPDSWELTGELPRFKEKKVEATPLSLSVVPVLEIKGTAASIDFSEISELFTTVSGAKLGDTDVYGSFESGVLTLDNAKIPNVSSSLGKNVSIVLLTDSGRYSLQVEIYTKIIASAEDLDKMLTEYATKTSVGTAKRAISVELFSYDGYFVLGNDIDYSEESARGVYNSGVSYLRTNYYAYNAANPAVINEAGFNGIFDGQGYAIENIEFSTTVNGSDGCFYTGGGLFGSIATTGLVKNLALKNAALTNVDGNAPIAGNCCGTLDNIAIDMVMENSTDVRTGGLVVGTLGAKLSNIFIHITGNGGHRFRYGYVSVYDHARTDGTATVATTVKNVYVARTSGTSQTVGQYLVVTQETGEYNPYDDGTDGVFASVRVYDKAAPDAADTNYGSGAFSAGISYQTYAQLATDLAAGNVIVFDDTSYWDLTGNYPVLSKQDN